MTQLSWLNKERWIEARRNPTIKRALESYEELQNVIDQLTPDQLTYILDLESQTRQRKSIIERCIRQQIKLYRQQLQRRYL